MVDETVAGLLQLQQSDPALFNQLARLMDLPLAPANSADTARQAAFEAREAELEAKLNPPRQPGLTWEERKRREASQARSQAATTGTPGPSETSTPNPELTVTENATSTEVNDYQGLSEIERTEINARLNEIIEETGDNRLNTLLAFFTDPTIAELSSSSLARDRLYLLLEVTSKNPLLGTHVRTQFGIDALAGDGGFAPEFQDQEFYRIVWNKGPEYLSPQVAHFLTAVNLADFELGGTGITFMIGHEKFSDDKKVGDFSRLLEAFAVTPVDIRLFLQAVDAHEVGDAQQRDALLWDILEMKPTTPFGHVEDERVGNSLQDLRLSLMGYVFNKWLDSNPDASSQEAANWLNENLGGSN